MLRDLEVLVEFIDEGVVSKESANDYIQAAASAYKQLDAMEQLPTVLLTTLTYLVFQIIRIIDTGKHLDITIEEIITHVESENVLIFLRERFKNDIDLSVVFFAGDHNETFERYYGRCLLAIYEGGNSHAKWGVENNGICLLLGWTMEIIQRGSGWYPSRDFAGLDD